MTSDLPIAAPWSCSLPAADLVGGCVLRLFWFNILSIPPQSSAPWNISGEAVTKEADITERILDSGMVWRYVTKVILELGLIRAWRACLGASNLFSFGILDPNSGAILKARNLSGKICKKGNAIRSRNGLQRNTGCGFFSAKRWIDAQQLARLQFPACAAKLLQRL